MRDIDDSELAARAYRKLAAVEVLHDPPCTGCLYSWTCANEPVACESFYRYHKQGFALRVRPTKRWYAKLFSDGRKFRTATAAPSW